MLQKYYYVDINGFPVGPVLHSDLPKLIEAGYIRRDTYVIEEGGVEWKPYALVSLEVEETLPARMGKY